MTTAPQATLQTTLRVTLAPQLQQALRILQLSAPELAEELERALADNPFLERQDERDAAESDAAPSSPAIAGVAEVASAADSPDAATSTQDEATTADDPSAGADAADGTDATEHDLFAVDDDVAAALAEEGDDWASALPSAASSDTSADWLDAINAAAPESLADHLHAQLRELKLLPEEAAALRFLIGSLDADGYLPDSLAELAATLVDDDDDMAQLHGLVVRLHDALQRLHDMDPPGVGAKDLAECLALQLKQRLRSVPSTDALMPLLHAAITICTHPQGLTWLAASDLTAIAAQAGLNSAGAQRLVALVATLEPKPGRRFADVRGHPIVPDVQVLVHGQGAQRHYQARLTRHGMSGVVVNTEYARLLEQAGAGNAALQELLQEAQRLVQSVQQRASTVLQVADFIVLRQWRFFEQGERALKPLAQVEIAQALELHESTISRAVDGKYMNTPRGTYPFRYFFDSGVPLQDGGQTSSTAVKAVISELISAEDPTRPLSDAAIAEELERQGIVCARRTVAKYRDALQIPSARQRKR